MANGSTYLTRTLSSGADRTKGTWSFWVKRGDAEDTTQQGIFGGRKNSSNDGNLFQILLQHNNNGAGVQCAFWNSSGTNLGNKRTSNAMRDLSAWYHVVCTIDTTLATADDRIKIYVNGERITSLAGSPNTNPSQNDTFAFFNNYSNHQQMVGGFYATGSTDEKGKLNGILSHVHVCDGYAYDASYFGETDSTTGEWKIITSPSVSYGTNGFFILKDGNSVTDQSGNGNNFTVAGGTLTNTEDNPSNVFATLSPHILPRNSGGSISNGNLTFGTSAAQWTTESSAFGIANGKYYFEVKLRDNGTDRRFRWGLQKNAEITKTGNNKVIGGSDNNAIGYATQGESATQGAYFINQTQTALTDGDINENNAIYGYAIDLDNQRMYGHFNGTWLHSGNPSAGTGGIDVSSFYTVGEPLFPSFTVHNSDIDINFGNGYFGTTAVSSAGTNASGIGIFEYDVPTGFTALSTKGLNE